MRLKQTNKNKMIKIWPNVCEKRKSQLLWRNTAKNRENEKEKEKKKKK